MRRGDNDRHYVIDTSKPWHVAWWARELGVPEESLLDAVQRVGVEAAAVEAYIGVRRAREQRH